MFRLGMSKSRDCAPGKMNFHMEMLLLNLLFYIVNLKKHFGKNVVRFLCYFIVCFFAISPILTVFFSIL